MKEGFANIQIVGRVVLRDDFEDIYIQSGANSKGEFLRMLLNNHLHPQKEQPNDETITNLHNVVEAKDSALDKLEKRLAIYEKNPVLQQILHKLKGTEYKFRDNQRHNRSIFVNEVKDVFTIVMLTLKVK